MYLLGLYMMILRVFHILEKYIRLRITEVLYSDTIERLIRQSFRISFVDNLGLCSAAARGRLLWMPKVKDVRNFFM